MNTPLVIAFLFAVGAMIGWCIEFLFRNLISHKGPRGKYFINPGLCKGPWLPIYGIGLSLMFIISWLVTENHPQLGIGAHLLVILNIMLVMVAIELIGGLFLLKVLNLRLWDYRQEPGNFMGLICPRFTLIWGAIGAAYYLLIHQIVIGWLVWLSQNLAFSFFVGLFFGVFVIDLISSAQDAAAIKRYGDDHNIVVKYEELKALLLEKEIELKGKQKSYFNQVRESLSLSETLDKSELHAKGGIFEEKKQKTGKN